MRHPFWLSRELAHLDPVRDARRYAQLSFETRFGLPIFIHALFSVAFAYNMGDPRIAATLYRQGTGTILRHTRQRNFETLVFFGQIYQHGDDPQGRQLIERMRRIHESFDIPNELYLYTLATLACLPRRLSERLAGAHGLTSAELEAQFRLWVRVGELMGIADIPPTQEAFLAWMQAHERQHFAWSEGAQAVVHALAAEWAEYWFPKPLQGWAQGVFNALIDPQLYPALGIRTPSVVQQQVAARTVSGFIRVARQLPLLGERSLSEEFRQRLPRRAA